MVVPAADYARPGSVAAAFFTGWASVDAVHDGPADPLARCVHLITPGLRHQLATDQPAAAQWQRMRRDHLISLVHVQALTHPAGAPPDTRDIVYLRVYALRVTTTAFGVRTLASDGVTVQLTRSGRRWLVARVLFW